MVSSLAPVADNVHATNHLTDGEEANDLGGGNTEESDLLGVGVANAGQEALGRGHAEVLDGGRVLEDVDEGLEVWLNGGQGTGENWRMLDPGLDWGDCAIAFDVTYGGDMFWPRNTNLPSSRPTRE